MMRHLLLISLIPILTSPIFAQVSPEILADGRVTFRITAPDAGNVTVRGQWTRDPVQLVKGEKGLWQGTTPAAVPAGVWEYGMMVDKLSTIDSRNPDIKPQRWPKTSILHIPSDPPAHWDLQHIPHGTLHYHDYWSKSLESWRRLVVYTPPSYQKSKKPLPVLYLSHGFSDNQSAWSKHGKAHSILDSLIHKKLAKPMLIVMPDAHPVDPEARVKEIYGPKNRAAFAKELVEVVLPFVEENYAVRKDRSGRAFAGLSMGGGHAFTVAVLHVDLFSQIGAFSSSPPTAEFMKENAEAASMNKNLSLFWIACGDKDRLLPENEEAHALMGQLGIKHTYVITPGDDHSWPVWRRYLIEFAPMLFQD